MATGTFDLAMVGLGVMGHNLLLNLERNGFSGVAYDISQQRIQEFLSGLGAGKRLTGAKDFAELAQKLERPRRVFILVPAGKPVDDVLDSLLQVLQKGDVVVECGNSYYQDTVRREKTLAAKGLHFTGMGISGGEEGALKGPSMMPGGPHDGYQRLEPLLRKIAAQVDDGPCVTYIGPGGAGHYVKMVHNGIEYGDMQLIAEAYDLLRRAGRLTNLELADVFETWNKGELESFLIEITARIFHQKDDQSDRMLLDVIKDSASMKGTGKWTVQDAMDRGVAIPTITAAVDARLISARFEERQTASRQLPAPPEGLPPMEKRPWVDAVRAALFCAKTCSYAQGMALLGQASLENKWNLPFGEIARIWKGGCIIRAKFLRSIQEAYAREPGLSNLLLDPYFKEALASRLDAWRQVVSTGARFGIPLPAMSASLSYFDSLRSGRLPANLVQAQRDLFGAHTYERLDKAGTFHTHWN